jgi:Flp pilus assembly protein TadG
MMSFSRHESGAAALELCLVLPILLVLFIAVFDFGFLLFQQMQVEAAAGAGALYAYNRGGANFDAAQVASAVAGASYPTQTTIAADPAPYKACGCLNPGGTGLVAATCGSVCSNGATAANYAVVSAKVTPTPIMSWPGYPASLNSGVVIRLK